MLTWVGVNSLIYNLKSYIIFQALRDLPNKLPSAWRLSRGNLNVNE